MATRVIVHNHLPKRTRDDIGESLEGYVRDLANAKEKLKTARTGEERKRWSKEVRDLSALVKDMRARWLKQSYDARDA